MPKCGEHLFLDEGLWAVFFSFSYLHLAGLYRMGFGKLWPVGPIAVSAHELRVVFTFLRGGKNKKQKSVV